MADTESERKAKDDLIRETIMSKLIETGEKDRLKGVNILFNLLTINTRVHSIPYHFLRLQRCCMTDWFPPDGEMS